jgi:superfamily II DNA/RNA helicase
MNFRNFGLFEHINFYLMTSTFEIENWLDHVQRSLESVSVQNKVKVPTAAVPPKGRRIRKVLCSATLSRNAKQSEDFGMVAPTVLVASERSRYIVPIGIVEQFIVVEHGQKIATLMALTEELHFILCFISTTKRCLAVSSAMKKLNPGLSVIEFASTIQGSQRRKALEEIVEGQGRLIVATDALARGIDLPFRFATFVPNLYTSNGQNSEGWSNRKMCDFCD